MSDDEQKWDPSELAALGPDDTVLRAIPDRHVVKWIESEQRWEINSAAMDSKQLTPSDLSGYGYSVYVTDHLSTRCGATAGSELLFMQSHVNQHACMPSWRDGIIVQVKVRDLLALQFGLGESPRDATCSTIEQAHASMWADPSWTPKQLRAQRNEALKLLGRSAVYEAPHRVQERLSAQASSSPPQPPVTTNHRGGGGTP